MSSNVHDIHSGATFSPFPQAAELLAGSAQKIRNVLRENGWRLDLTGPSAWTLHDQYGRSARIARLSGQWHLACDATIAAALRIVLATAAHQGQVTASRAS